MTDPIRARLDDWSMRGDKDERAWHALRAVLDLGECECFVIFGGGKSGCWPCDIRRVIAENLGVTDEQA